MQSTQSVAASLPATDEYAKYRKMIKIKMPKESVINRMRQDGIDKAVIAEYEETDKLPPEPMSISPSTGPSAAPPPPAPSAPKKDEYAKYRKMLKIKMPKESVVNRMRQDGIAKEVVAHFEEHGTFPDAASLSAAPPPADDGLSKYRKMLKIGMPKASVVNRMRQDGIDKEVIRNYEENDVLKKAEKARISEEDEKKLSKYRKMLKICMPRQSVINRMRQDEVGAPLIALLFPEAVEAKQKEKEKERVITKEEEEKLTKYRKMLKICMPKQSVINRMRQDEMPPHLIGCLFPDSVESRACRQQRGQSKKGSLSMAELMKQSTANKKKTAKPKTKMRTLHWTAIKKEDDIKQTIWGDVGDANMEIVFDVEIVRDLETNFSVKPSASSSADALKTRSDKSKKASVVRVLDARRSYNIEIFLGRLKMDPWVVREAMLAMDSSKLPLDLVHKLKKFVPTKEESKQMEGFDDAQNLGVAEKFVKIVRTVDDDLVERLVLWEFKLEFERLHLKERTALEWLKKGHDAIFESKALKLMFSLILSIGNFLNDSTAKGQARGFKLSSLGQLVSSRTSDNKSTLMEYLYLFCINNGSDKYQEALKFAEDLLPLEEAKSIDIPTLRQNIGALNKNVQLIAARVAKEGITRMGDNFYKIMKPFYDEAKLKVQSLMKQRDDTFAALKALGVWLNEPKDTSFKYMKTLNEFRKNFNRSVLVVQQKKARLAEMEKKRKWAEQKREKKELLQRQKEKEKEKEKQETKSLKTDKKAEADMFENECVLINVVQKQADSNREHAENTKTTKNIESSKNTKNSKKPKKHKASPMSNGRRNSTENAKKENVNEKKQTPKSNEESSTNSRHGDGDGDRDRDGDGQRMSNTANKSRDERPRINSGIDYGQRTSNMFKEQMNSQPKRVRRLSSGSNTAFTKRLQNMHSNMYL